MKNLKHTLLIILCCIALVSCATQRACQRKFPPREFKTTEIETVERNHVITLNRDMIELIGGSDIIITNGIISAEPSIIETEFCISKAWIDGDRLRHILEQKAIHITDTVIVTETVIREKEGQIVEVPAQLKWWQKTLAWIGAASTAIFLLSILIFALRLKV